jgi:hypothetical protein
MRLAGKKMHAGFLSKIRAAKLDREKAEHAPLLGRILRGFFASLRMT